jgi:hypothetical protein
MLCYRELAAITTRLMRLSRANGAKANLEWETVSICESRSFLQDIESIVVKEREHPA